MPQRKGKLSNLERESTGAQIFGDERRWGLNNECLSAGQAGRTGSTFTQPSYESSLTFFLVKTTQPIRISIIVKLNQPSTSPIIG